MEQKEKEVDEGEGNGLLGCPRIPPAPHHPALTQPTNTTTTIKMIPQDDRRRFSDPILNPDPVADVMLWRRSNVTIGILFGTLAAWVVFEVSGYTLVSLVSTVLLLLASIIFVWAKAAEILNRPPPPIPELQLAQESINEAAVFLGSHVNGILLISCEIALGKDKELFYKVTACLWLMSLVGGLTDFLTLSYTCLLIALTIPALYEKHEDYVDRYVMMGHAEVQYAYMCYVECFSEAQKWILEVTKNLSE